MTPEQLAAAAARFEQDEGRTTWLYRDDSTEGFLTCGVGHLVVDLAHAELLSFTPPITVDEWGRLLQAPAGRLAAFYTRYTVGRMSEADVTALRDQDIQAALEDLAKCFNGFNGYPGDAQAAILDMRLNLGLGKLLIGFPLLCAAIRAQDWATCAAQCHRMPPISEARNAQTAALFNSAVGGTSEG